MPCRRWPGAPPGKRFTPAARPTSRNSTGMQPAHDATTAIAARRRQTPGHGRERSPARQNRDEQEQHDDAEVLEQEDATMRRPWASRAGCAAQLLQDDGRAGQRHEEADEQPSRHDAGRGSRARARARRAAVPRDLERAAEDDLPPDAPDSVSENSRPTVNSSSTMPISASLSTSSWVWTMPRPAGPATAPATMKDTIGGMRIRLRTSMRASAMAYVRTSSARGACPGM